ncbi:MAG: hypothetical protein DDG60_11290 [Anaerolineae bacterium]|nr:MAG: hypothetical protein DDG60_11290 [Anaerolineae bacterium]
MRSNPARHSLLLTRKTPNSNLPLPHGSDCQPLSSVSLAPFSFVAWLNMTEIIHLSQLPANLLPALTDLHLATMPTLLTELGKPFVLRYYQLAQADPTVIALVARSTASHPLPSTALPPSSGENDLLGYCLGSPCPSSLTARLRSPAAWFAKHILSATFSHPSVLLQLAQSTLFASKANTLQPGQIELTYIGVAPQARGYGLGTKLLTAFAESAQKTGYTSIALSVETDNLPALALYAKFGFRITQTFTEGRYHRHRMEYRLGT